METEFKEQVVVWLRKDIIERAKFKAWQYNISLNEYLEDVVSTAVIPAIPKLPKNFKISPQVQALSGIIPTPTPEQLAADDRLAYILGKGN